MDCPILDLLNLIRLDVDIYHNARVCGAWSISEHSDNDTCFHIATQDSCNLVVPGHLETTLEQGDLVIFPRELPHTMTPSTDMEGEQKHLPYLAGIGQPGTSLLCGTLRFQHRASQHMLNALPAVFVVRYSESKSWLDPLLLLIVEESMQADYVASALVNKLCELMLFYALRHFINEHPAEVGMLKVYADTRIGKTVLAMHRQPAKPWQLEELGALAAMSRSKFAAEFKVLSGWTPFQYLTWWRMQLAWVELKNGALVSQVAESVGYQSEAAFSRSFKKAFGVSASKVKHLGRDV